jgi:hypothetical protein
MKRLIFLIGLLWFSNLLVNAQNLEEVVYLKNGGIIRGTIIEQIPNKSIKIQTKDGNVFVYNMDEVEKLTKEPVRATGYNNYNGNTNSFSNSRVETGNSIFMVSSYMWWWSIL